MARNRALSDDDLYRFHVENLRSVDRAVQEVELLAKDAIRRNKASTVDSLLRSHMLLLGVWAECRLKKLLNEKSGFTQQERELVRGTKTQHEKWKAVIELGFKKRCGVQTLTMPPLMFSAFHRYKALIEAFDQDIAPIIELRNKLAHGQWAYLLTDEEDAIAAKAMERLKTENLLRSKIRFQILSHIAALVHDLVVSTAFERDFDDHYNKLLQARQSLKNRRYESYVTDLRERFRRGLQKKSEKALLTPT